MKIYRIDEQNKKILVEIPITTPTGKIRIKERDNYTTLGSPVATRQKILDKKMYVEWQVSYDLEINSENIKNSTFYASTEMNFIANNKKTKIPYELSEYFYYFYKMNIFNDNDIKEITNYLTNKCDSDLIENLYQISKCYFKRTTVEATILEGVILYPHLIYDFSDKFHIIFEITIAEKQKAVGLQPMLYMCFPVSYLKEKEGEESLIGRAAKENEKAIFEFNKENAFIIKEGFKIFGTLSKSHKYDIMEILKLIKCPSSYPIIIL